MEDEPSFEIDYFDIDDWLFLSQNIACTMIIYIGIFTISFAIIVINISILNI
jgi:hypothetical protein